MSSLSSLSSCASVSSLATPPLPTTLNMNKRPRPNTFDSSISELKRGCTPSSLPFQSTESCCLEETLAKIVISYAKTRIPDELEKTETPGTSEKTRTPEDLEFISQELMQLFSKTPCVNLTKPVIFLDIDGVIFKNPEDDSIKNKAKNLFPDMDPSDFTSFHYDTAATHLFNPLATLNLHQLIRTTDASIVISSSWREDRNVSNLKAIFAKHLFSESIIDKTPDSVEEDSPFADRANEIHFWLKNHPEVINFTILDDYDNDLSKCFPRNFVNINADKLLTKADAEQAEKILKEVK